MIGLALKNIHKSFGDTPVLHGVSFNIHEGEIVALLGPSGCGKSTLLSIIAGLEHPDKGNITWNTELIINLPPHKRGFGLMFQDYMLFPHKNVEANIAFGLKMENWPHPMIESRVKEVLEMVNLTGYSHRDVNTLSGGEQQRVALARSLAPNPRLLMLDEPLGALDRALRERLQDELATILRSTEQTALYVTHDQEEAFSVADRVVVMDQGSVAQIGVPQEIYKQPNSEYVARFLGLGNIFTGQYREGCLVTDIGEFRIRDLETWRTVNNQPIIQLNSFPILIRPDVIRLDGRGTHEIFGFVLNKKFRGNLCRVKIQINDQKLDLDFSSSTSLPEVGSTAKFSFNPKEAIQILS